MNFAIPQKQKAVQLTGPDELRLNTEKQVHRPGPYQILCKVEAVGLCFSDLKLLKQFSSHARKGNIQSGIDVKILEQIPSYVPAQKPAVPGHEAVVRICEVGERVETIKPGDRYLVQTDYRWLPNTNSNASFGYNFEGGLQQYVLMDQRVITSPQGESMLIPASEKLSASAIALVEPWACVENSYAAKQRCRLSSGGKMLVVVDEGESDSADEKIFTAFLGRFGEPSNITVISKATILKGLNIEPIFIDGISAAEDTGYDDVIYFGSDPDKAEELFGKVAAGGLINFVLCGKKFDSDIETHIGRVHYGGIRIIGTTGFDPAESMQYIPFSGEIREGDNINIIGAAGPMGVMHVIRNICQGLKDITVYAGDLDADRLGILSRIVQPLAKKNKLGYKPYDPSKNNPEIAMDYAAIMAPVPKIVADAVKHCNEMGIINIFAGIPADVKAMLDLDGYIEKHLYFIGTSGSVLEDMKTVLAKVESGSLDTNLSVAAICGLEGAVEGIRAIEKRLIPGKIIVYPSVLGPGLLTLDKLREQMPEVAEKLSDGLWTGQAEEELLKGTPKIEMGRAGFEPA